MSFEKHFNHNIIRKVTVAFGTLFNDIDVVRYDSNGNPVDRIKVPITYSGKNRTLDILSKVKTISTAVPRLSFIYTGMTPSSERSLNPRQTIRHQPSDEVTNIQYTPSPWNLNFTVYVYLKNQSDGHQIIEQIVPHFRPSFTMSIKSVPDTDLVDDLLITLESVQTPDDFQGGFEDKSVLVWQMQFNIPVNFHGIVTQQGLIKEVHTHIFDQVPGYDNDITLDDMGIQIVHIARVDPSTAGPDDPHTITETIDEPEGKVKYDAETGTYIDV